MRTPESFSYLGPKLRLHPGEVKDAFLDEFLIGRVAGKVDATGQENIPKKGAFVLGLSPHSGIFDGISTRREMRKQLRPVDIMTRIETESELPGILRGPRMFFYERYGQVDNQAIDDAKQILNQGGIVASAFEMTRGRGTTEDLMRLRRARKGLVLLAMQADYQKRLGVPILPVATIGAEQEQLFPIPQNIVAIKGKAGLFKDVMREAIRFRGKPPLQVHFSPLYTDHLNDVKVENQRTFLRIVDTHAHLITLTRIIPHLPEGYPLGFYENKTPETYLEQLERLRAKL